MDIKIDIDALLCKFLEPNHQLKDARILPCCGETACHKCIVKCSGLTSSSPETINDKSKLFICKFCNNLNSIDNVIENKIINSIISKYSNQNCELMKNYETINKLVGEVEEKRVQVEEFLSSKLPKIKIDIRNQLEFIKESLDEIEEELQAQLVEFKERVEEDLENLPKFNHIIEYAENKADASLNQQYIDELNKINIKLSKSINSIRFEPNSEVLNSSIIGYIIKLKQTYFNIDRLSEVKSKYLISMTTNEKMPLDVVGLTLDSDTNIILPERNEGNLMKLNLNGELIGESNLKTEFKNSCGLCINCKKEILVTDGKLNKIFRFNSNLKLLQIIGSYLGSRYGSLNFPWGIATDIENDDSIYVCDNGNDRLLVFNNNGEPKSIITFENCQHPRKLQLVDNSIYVLHKNDNEIFVSIVDKVTQQLMSSIKQNEINIKSFYIDSSYNLIKVGQLNADSSMQYLVSTKKNGQSLFKTILNVEHIIWDFCFRIADSNVQMICATNEGIYVFEF